MAKKQHQKQGLKLNRKRGVAGRLNIALTGFAVVVMSAAIGAGVASYMAGRWMPTVSPDARAQTRIDPATATKALFLAVEKNDLPGVRAAVESGANIEAKNELGIQAVEMAVDRGHFDIAHYLISVRNALATRPRLRALPQEPSAQEPSATSTQEPPAPLEPEVAPEAVPEVAPEVAQTPPAPLALEPLKPEPEPEPQEPSLAAPETTLGDQTTAPQSQTVEAPDLGADRTSPPGEPLVATSPQADPAMADDLSGDKTTGQTDGDELVLVIDEKDLSPEGEKKTGDEPQLELKIEEPSAPSGIEPSATSRIEPSAAPVAKLADQARSAIEPAQPQRAPSEPPEPMSATKRFFYTFFDFFKPPNTTGVVRRPRRPEPTTTDDDAANAEMVARQLEELKARQGAVPTLQETQAAAEEAQIKAEAEAIAKAEAEASASAEAASLAAEEAEFERVQIEARAKAAAEAEEIRLAARATIEAEAEAAKQASVAKAAEEKLATLPAATSYSGSGEILDNVIFKLGDELHVGLELSEARLERMKDVSIHRPCVAKDRPLAMFCVETVYWPLDIEEYFLVDNIMYQGNRAIARYDRNRATRFHVMFRSDSLDVVINHFVELYGVPTQAIARAIAPLAKPRRDNPTLLWQSREPGTDAIINLEVRQYDDARGGFPDIERGVVMLYKTHARPIFPILSQLEMMVLKPEDEADTYATPSEGGAEEDAEAPESAN